MKYLKYAVLLLSLSAIVSLPVNAISIRSLLGLDEEEENTEQQVETKETAKTESTSKSAANENGAKVNKDSANTNINLPLIRLLIANIGPAQRNALLADEAVFKQFVKQEATNHSVLAAAHANKIGENKNTAFLMQRGADNILREVYLNKLIEAKLPKDFPSDAQVKEYFDQNKDNFVIAERMHVWQVFFPVNETTDKNKIAELKKTADTVATQLKKGSISFSEAANKYSQHAPSNVNGGYMGLINTADLKPGLKKELLELGEGKISAVLTTDTGLHIVKRGTIVPERKITLEESKPRIKELLVKQVRTQLRTAIFEQAGKTYPVDLPEAKIEEWRLRLKTNVAGAATSKN
jgi:parvulin-like peptidyl-prolyl isomerase